MKIVAFITDHEVVDRIIDHLKLRFISEKPPGRPSLHRGRPDGIRVGRGVFLRSGYFEMNGKSIVFRAIFRTSRPMLRTDDLRCAYSLVLDIPPYRRYSRFVMGSVDSDLSGRESRAAQKSKFLSSKIGNSSRCGKRNFL